MGCSFQLIFRAARNMRVYVPSSADVCAFVSVQVVEPYRSTDSTTAVKKCLFMVFDRSDFHMGSSLLSADHAFPFRILISLSVDLILLPKYVNSVTCLILFLSRDAMFPVVFKTDKFCFLSIYT